MRTAARHLATTARVFARAWWRSALVVLAMFAIALAAVWAYALTLGPKVYGALAPAADTLTSRTGVTLLTVLPLLLVFALLGTVWAGALILISDRVERGLPVSTLAAVRVGFARCLTALAVTVAWFAAVVVVLVATPVLVLAGLVGLVVALATRRPGRPDWLPPTRTLATMAIPLGAVALVAARLSRALPAAWIDRRGVREALTSSWNETRGRAWTPAIVLAATALAVVALTQAAALLIDSWGAVTSAAVQALVGGIPIIALAVLYRSDRLGGPSPADAVVAPRPGARTARVAAAMVAALVVQAAAVSAGATPAAALDFSTPTVTVSTAPSHDIVAGSEMAISIRVRHATLGDDADLPTGNVTVKLNGSSVGGALALEDGNVNIPYSSGLPAGDYTVDVTYAGDANYGPASGSTTFTVGSAGSVTLDIPDADLMFGDTLHATAHVSLGGVAQGGTVAFTATPSSGPLLDLGSATIDSSGDATLDDATVPPGDYILTAVYQGDAGGSVMSSPGQSFTVAAHFTEVTASLSPSSSPGSPSAPGGTVTATIHVTANGSSLVPTGSIEIYPDGAGGDLLASGPLVNGAATLTMVLPPGSPYGVKITYVASAGFYGSYTTESQYVGTWGSSLGLAGAPTSAFGDGVDLTATATSSVTPTGSVSFFATPDGGSPTLLGSGPLNGAGVAHFTATGLAPGNYQFTAHYGGDGTAGAADASGFSHTVGLAPASVALTLSGVLTYPDTAAASFEVSTTASGAGTPSGTVVISIDGAYFATVTLDANGKGGLTLPVLLPGAHDVRAVYGGNSVVATGEDTQVLTVTKAAPTVTLDGAPVRTATYGDSQVYSGAVRALGMPAIPSGTVQLWADGYIVGTGTLDAAGGYSVTTTTIPAMPSPGQRVIVVKYLGDSTYLPAQSADAVVTSVAQASAAPVVTLGPGPLGIGGTYTLTATMPSIGAGATGTVTFHVTGGADIGPVTLVGGSASTSFLITGADTYVTASYSGDANFAARDSALTLFTADRSAATVELLTNPPSDPNLFAYGNTFELVARVTIAGGLETDGLVTFKTAGGMTVAENVPTTFFPSQGYGLARVTVCAGDVAGCPIGVPVIGVFDQALLATYPQSTINLAASSPSLAYSMTKAPTATSLDVNPTSVQVGSGIYLTATVSNALGGPKPTGLVSFYGLEPGPSGPAENFIGSAEVVDGVAMLTSSVGDGAGQLRSPATQVVARFLDIENKFGASSGSKAVTVARAGTSVAVTSTPAVAGTASTLTATISHVPGYSAAYTGQVEFFLDGASTPACSPWVSGSATTVTCTVTWATGGDHTVVAKYLGDLIYAPSDSPSTTIAVGGSVLTANLLPVTPGIAVALTPQTVTWTPGSLTGTVSVYGGGSLWCTVPVSAGSCSGQFTNNDAAASPVNVVIRYSGDASHSPRQYDLSTLVTACRVVDVHANNSSRGTVAVSPAPSCGTGGYPVGTVVTATATPIAPNAFLRWRGYTKFDAGLVTLSTSPTTSFTVTNDSWTWVRVADFAVPCYTLATELTGNGMVYTTPATNCTTPSGAPGYELGTTVNLVPLGLRNAEYGVPDVFYAFGTLPAGATTGTNSFGRSFVSLTMTADAVVPATFGPRCVQVAVTGNPVSKGDTYAVTTAPNCSQPNSPGFLPATDVTVTAASGNPALLVGGWSTTKADVPTLPTGPSATLTVGTDDVTVTANWVACYGVDVVVDAPTLYRKGKGAVVPTLGGAATLSPAPNCPDGSARFLSGTEVTATPSIEVQGVIFRGWDGDTSAGNGGLEGTGVMANRAKTVTVTGPTTLTASFFMEEGCSRLSITDRQNSVALAPTGCGPGMYSDLQKAFAIASGQKQSELWQDRYRSTITVTKKPGTVLDVYASVRGDATTCFGKAPAKSGPQDGSGWRSLGALKGGAQDCLVGGDISMRFEQCQTLDTSVAIVRDDDPEALRYGVNDLPSYLLVPTTAGNFAPMTTRDFSWVKSGAVEPDGDGYVELRQPDGACKDAGNAFQPGTIVQVGADSISQGISFVGWTSDADRDLVQSNPVLMETTDTRKSLPVAAFYSMTCYHVTFGEGITIEGEAPRCPGYADEDNMFIAGTGIQIRAAQHVGSRTFGDWTSGVLAATTVVDPASGQRTAVAYVNGNMKVAAKYPTEGERWENGFANGGKLLVGVAAVLAPVVVGIACPPCGIALTVVGVAGAASSLIPGGGAVADFFSLINPTKITECAASWAFGKEEPRTKSDAGSLVKTGTGVKKIVEVIKPPPTAAELAAAAAGKVSTTGKLLSGIKAGGKATLKTAAIGYSLYSAGIADADLGFETTEQLRDTKTMTSCLDEAWKFAS